MPSEYFSAWQPNADNTLPQSAMDRCKGESTEPAPAMNAQRRAARMEARMEDGQKGELEIGPDYTMTLKNGERIDIKDGYAAWNNLNYVLQKQPALFAAVWAKAQGEKISPAMQRALRRALLTLKSGELRNGILNVVLSAYQKTPDGPVIVNPFKLETEADRQAFDDCERRGLRNTEQLFGGDDLPDDLRR
jgi:hypothetical protein